MIAFMLKGITDGNTRVKTGVQVVWYGGTSSWNTETNVNSQVNIIHNELDVRLFHFGGSIRTRETKNSALP
jgi:hypothetical protein